MMGRSRQSGSPPDPSVHRVTSAQESLSEGQSRRTRRYLISMSIRTVCFLLAVFTNGWLQWAFLAGAVVLPYLAVVAANAGRENDPFVGEVPPPTTRALPPAQGPVIDASHPDGMADPTTGPTSNPASGPH